MSRRDLSKLGRTAVTLEGLPLFHVDAKARPLEVDLVGGVAELAGAGVSLDDSVDEAGIEQAA